MQVVGSAGGVRSPEPGGAGLLLDGHGRGGRQRVERDTAAAGEDQRRGAEDRQQFGVGGADAADRSHFVRQVAVEDGHQPGEATLDLLDVDDVRRGDAELG